MVQSSKGVTRIIAGLELIGAFVTAGILGYEIFESIQKQGILSEEVLFLIPFCLFFIVLGGVAGWQLWQNSKRGYWLSIILQAFQVVNFASVPLTYFYAAGVYFIINYSAGDISLQASAGSQIDIYINNPKEVASFGINLVALFFLIHLFNCLRRDSTINR